ncbi:MAG: fatty acid desaturase [Chthoniobacteraceae bacterium]
MNATDSAIEPHEPHWIGRSAFQMLALMFMASQVGLGFAVYHANYWIAVPLVFVTSHLMHAMLIGFHEATHGLLRKSRVLNEIDGIIIGTLSLMSFSLYRAAHQLHHAYLASERDEELWPFVHPEMPRWARVGAAITELTMGLFFTPFLFIRTFLRAGSPIRNKKLRRRIWLEFAGTAVVWTAILTAIAIFDAWKYFLWLHVMPAWLAANMQSLRKYVEHVGLTGSTVNSATRSIVAEGWVATFLNFTLLHEPYHGVHHWRSGLPHLELPQHAEALEPSADEERPPFRTFSAALRDLFINLADPRVGAQWRGMAKPTRQEMARQATS